MTGMPLHKCYRCLVPKPLAEFPIRSVRRSDGSAYTYPRTVCRECKRAHDRSRYRGAPPLEPKSQKGAHCTVCEGLPHRRGGIRCSGCRELHKEEPALQVTNYLRNYAVREVT